MEDLEIIDLYWNRREEAISETDLKYGKLCKSISYNILLSEEDAEECVNDAYLGAWNSIPDARPGVFSAFLCRIVRNLSLKRYEYIHAGKRNPGVAVSLEELYGCISENGEPEGFETEYSDSVLSEAINRFLELLSAEACNIFVRRYWFFDPIKDIAARYGMSESKVNSNLARTRNKFRLFLIKEGFSEL